MGAKSNDTGEKILIMKNGSKHKVKGSTGKFWLCEGTQFKKSNPDILEVVDAKPQVKKEKEVVVEEKPEKIDESEVTEDE